MELGLKGRHVAILAADGVDGAQVSSLRGALAGAGAAAEVVAARSGDVKAAAGAVAADRTFEVCHASDYDALVIPGGRDSADALQKEQRALQFVREFMAADKPVAVVGEGVRVLIAADAVAGRELAAPPELADEIRRGGAQPVEAAIHVDAKLVSSRGGDLGQLGAVVLREFANRVDEARVDQLSEQSFPASDPPPGPMAVGGEGASTALHLESGKPGRAERSDAEPGARS